MLLTIWLDGSFVDPEAAHVSLFDRGYLLGDSAFATMRAIHGSIFRSGAHFARLYAALDAFGIELPFGRTTLQGAVLDAVERHAGPDITIRVTVSRGPGPLGISTRADLRATASVVARHTTVYPEHLYVQGIATKVVTTRRVPSACLPPSAKSGSYLPQVLAHRELGEVPEGLQRSFDGQIASGTISNVFLIRGDELVTPHEASDCRAGVTREVLLETAEHVGLRATERRVDDSDLAMADEVFFASTVMECLPVNRIEGLAKLRGFARTRDLRRMLRDLMAP